MNPTSAAEARHAIADALRAALGPTVAVFAQPPETATAPGLVVAPRAPYRRPSTFCQYELDLRVVGLVQRNAGPDAFDFLDGMMDRVIGALGDLPWLTWTSAPDVAVTQEVGSVEYLAATIDITAYI